MTIEFTGLRRRECGNIALPLKNGFVKDWGISMMRFFRAAIFFCLGLFFLGFTLSTGSTGQDASESDSVEPLRIKVSVTEVSLDVVVLDKKTGNPITDLTAADFEVYQDGKQQAVKTAAYIDSQPDAAARPVAARKNAPNLPLFSAPALKKEDVRRTILFVVDDYAMDFQNGNYAKMALRNFVEKQMQPGDVVSILRTDYGNRALNMFQSDKREVLSRINALPSTMAPRLADQYNPFGVGPGMYNHFLIKLHENQISALSYSLSVLKNMPGRKILFMVTPLTVHGDRENSDPRMFDYFSKLYVRLADDAMRAGVVVNLLDIDGLNNFKSNYGDASMWMSSGIGGSIDQQLLLQKLQYVRMERIPEPNPIPEITGGITIRNNNFFLDGIGKETESLMRGYYLVSYAPPTDTFEKRDRKDVFRRLKVRVNRKDAAVHTRSGFFGRLEPEPEAAAQVHPLIEAIYSPYESTDLNVDIAAGYVKDAKAGYLVRSWIHLDPADVKIVETENGRGRIELEALCLTSGINGNIQDSKSVEFTLSNIDIAWVQKHGIRFSMLLPVKKSGPYYIRVSVQDKETGKVGSAYQFLEIPDIGKKGPALSNIFMITSADDLEWMRSDVTKGIAEGVFFPMFQGEDVRSPALRTYKRGDNLQTLTMLYNADAKAIAGLEIETQTILYRDGKEFLRGEPTPITLDKVDNSGSIPLLNRLTVGSNMPPGDYVLQILAIDKKSNKKNESAVYQTLGFKVAEN